MDPIDDTPVSALPSPAALALRERLNRLQQVGLEKRASLNKVTPQEQMLQELEQDRHTKTTAELRAIYGDGLAIMADNTNRLEAQQEINRTRGRTLGELVVDNPLAMARTGVTITGGGLAFSDRLNRLGGPGAVTDRLLGSGVFGEEITKRYVENRTRASTAVVKATSAVDAALGRRMSSASQASDQYVNAQIAAGQQKNRTAYDLAVADGESPWLAGAKRIGSDLGDSVKATASDGTALSNLVVGQVPTLAIGIGARAAVTAEGIAARAALLAEREAVRGGMGTFGITAARVTPALEAKAAQQLATRNLMVGTGLSEGAGGYQQAAGEIAAMSLTELAEAFPEYAERLRTEIDPEAVRGEIMGKVGMRAAVLQGIAAGGISRIASRFELSPLTSGVSSAKRAATRLRANVSNVLHEGAEETLQSGSGQLAVNVANLAVGRQDTDLLAGVGTAMGQGLVGGLGLSGAMQAPSAAGNAAAAAGSLALGGVGKGALWAAAKIKARGENVREAMKGEADKDFLGAVEAQATVAAAMPDILRQAGPVAEAADFSLKPSDNVPEGLVTPTEGKPVTNKLQAQASAIYQLATQPDMDNARRLQLKVFVAHNARETQDQIGQVLQPALDAATDDVTREQLATAIQHLSLFTDGDEVQQIRAELADLPQAQIDQTLETLPKDLIDPSMELPGVLQSTINLIDELVLAAPSRLSAEQLDRVMLQRSHMRPAQRARLDAALAYARSRANYDEILELTQAAGGTKVKAASVVSDQIQLRGFKEQGGQLVSLDEHFKKVNEAMAANQLPVAEKQFKQLLGWAANAQVRAGALQDQALKQLEAGVDAFVPSNFRSTDDSGALGKETFKVNPFQKQGAGALELIAADANMVAETVDALVAAYPSLAEVEYRGKDGTVTKAENIGRVNRIDFIGMRQQGKNGAAQAAAASSRLTLALAQAGERRRNVQASLDPDGRVQLVDADEMKRNQKAPAVLRADGKPMTSAQLGRLLSGQSVVDLLTPKATDTPARAQPAQPAAPITDEEAAAGAAASEERATPEAETETETETETGQAPAPVATAPKAVSRITVKQAKSLSDAGLNDRINALMDKRAAKTNTAEDDATFDVLNDEMNARETVAAEAEADSNTPTSPEGKKLKQLIPKLQTQVAMEAAESFIAGTLTLASKAVVKIPSTILVRAVALAERIANGWASYPHDGSFSEQSKWFLGKGRSVPQPSELQDLLRETYQAAEAIDRFGTPPMLTAAEASGSVFTPAILTNWTKGRQVIDGVTDMENLCLITSRHVEWILRAHGYKAAVAYGSVNVPGGKTDRKMDHYVAMAEIDDQIFIVDQPQGELFQSIGKGNKVKILRQEYAPRFIPLADLDAAYGTVGVEFKLASNISLTALPISDFALSAQAKPTLEERVARNKEALAAWKEMRALQERVEQLEQALQPKPEEPVEGKQDAPVAEQAVSPVRESRSLSERFSGLVSAVKDVVDVGRAQLLAFSNRFKQIYSPQVDGLFDRLEGGAAGIVRAIDENRLAELLPENRRYMVRPETDVDALREFFGTRVDEVVASLNKRLNAEMQKMMPAGKFAGRTRLEVFQSGEQPDMWNFLDFTSLHAMQVNEDGTVAYHPEVAEAMALVALRWTLDQRSRPVKPNWEKIDARWGGHHRIPQNIREAYQSGFMLEDAARTLSNELRQVLGLTLKSDMPVTMDSELMLSLSLNALHAAHSRGYFNLISETVPEGFNESKLTPTLHFANFDASRWNQDDERIPNEDLVDVLLTPFRESLPSIGQPHDQKVFKAKGTNQSLSEEQRRVEQVHNAQAFYLNDGLLDVFDKIGWDTFRKLRGYRNDLDQLNRVDRAAKAGLNQSISYQDNHMERLLQGVKAYALSTGTAPEQVPVHWFHRTLGTNGRVMAQGVAPQNDKLFRELFGMKPRTITKGDPENEQRLFAAVAQALGLAKLEKVGLAAAADKLQEALALPEMQAMLEHMTAPGQEFMSLVQALEAAARNAGLKIEVADTKSVHALYALAQYNKTETGAEFASNLTIEIDGVNNGPHNAHLQFFYGDLTVEDLRQMGQGGVYVGTGKETVLADAGDVGDRYTDVSALTTQLANENRGDLSIPESIRELYGPMLRALEHAGQVTVYDEEQAKAHGRPFEFDRKFGKSVLVPVGYMSGQKAVSAKIASTLLDAFYDEISKALIAKRPVDPRVVARFARLVEGTVNKKGNVFSVGKFTLPTSEEGLRDFRVRDPFVKALVNNINLTLGKDAFTAADTNLKKSRKVLGAVVSLSQLQAAMANELFRARYEQRRAELIEAGELGKFDGLSKDQEQELLRELKDVLPNVALMHTTEDDPSEGLSAVVRDKGEAFTTKVIARDGASRDRARVVHAFGSKISARVTRMGIGDPGVSMAPLLTIGSGDVSMMHLLKMLQGTPEFLNIWDGIDVHFSQAADMGVAANQAAFETWQNTVLESVLDAANRIDRTLLDTLPAERMDAVAAQAFSAFELASAAFKKLHPKISDPTEEKAFWDLYKRFKSGPVEALQDSGLDSRELVNTLFNKTVRQLTYATQERQDAWQAMTELGVSVDQMAGGGRAFVHPGSGEAMSPTEVVDYVNTRKAQLKKLRREEAEQAAGTNTRTLREGNLRHLVAPDADQVSLTKEQALRVLLSKNVLPGKVASSMLRMVQKMIPDNVRIILASEEQADSLAESLGMTGLDDWNGVAIPGSEPTVIVRNFSSVTLAHELMHVALSNMLHEYKTRGRKNNTTPLQRNAMDMLEKLAEAFLELDPETAQDYRARDRLALMQQTMQELKDNGDVGGMIDEFIAYAMTEALVQEDLMHRELPSMLRRISSKVREFIRRILGLPANAATDNWLEEVFGQVRTLVHKMQAPYEAIQASPARGQMNGRLGEVYDRFSALVEAVRPSNEKIPLQTYALANQVTKATLAFLNKGFDLDADQRRVFMQVQMVFAAGMQLDPETQHALYRSYEHAMKHLTARDLMDDPTSNGLDQITEGEVRLAALQGVDTTVPNAVGQTNQLANFVALAQVDPILRNALAKLPPMRGPKEAKNIDDVLREATTRIIDTGSDLQVGTLRTKNQLEALDFLVARMASEQTRLRDRAAALKRDSVVDTAEGWVKDKMVAGAEKLTAQADALRAGGENASRKEQIAREGVARLLDGLAAMSSSKRADAWTESLVSLLNEGSSFTPARELLRELLGTSPSAQAFSKLLNQSKQAVSTVRQRLREETPRQVKKWFKTPLTKKEWQRLSTLVGRTDVAAVWDTVPREALLAALSEPAKLQELIQVREELLGNSNDSARLKEASDDLAHWMVHRHNKAKRFLYRNAEAIAGQHGQRPVAGAAKHIATIDELVSLRALEKLSADQRQALRMLIEREPEAMDRLVQTLRALGEIEGKKPGGEMANRWKGWIPESTDPRKQVRLATPEQAKELLKMGWERLDSYRGDAAETQLGLAYYASSTATEVAYSQGALQMVLNTAGGTMADTGHTLSPVTGLVISDPVQVQRISMAKRMGKGDPKGENMIPVFRFNEEDGVMEIVAYERTLNAGLVQAHTKGDSDLAVGIGIWMGRQAEEELAGQFNSQLVEQLKEAWDKEQLERGEEYIALNLSKDPIDRDTWQSIPERTKKLLLERFDGKVMVRRDVRNNAFGYRNMSVRDVFTGISGLKPEARKMIEDLALGILGKRAYPVMTRIEDAVQGVVGMSKDMIVVRSGVVAVANLVANQFQLLAQGVPLTELPRQLKIAKQIETYLRNEHRLARIQTDLRAATETAEINRLNGEAARLLEENRRLQIYDLIEAGELPTIAEGLSETDEYTLVADGMRWIEEKTAGLPQGIKTFGRYATIAPDTALYQGLNRLIQFGDLMAKQLMYEKLLRDGMTKEAALNYVRDNFVNYNLLPGRTRTALEQMGVLWFWNYKLRIQKIFFRTIRDNPLRALMAFGAAGASGVDSLWSSQAINANLSYSVGYDQLAGAHSMNMWWQVFGK